ncbi:AAA family ATPase [Arcanobacterium wilhelmae]|uniref:AAA family ATPase n=1 Tax=Arcanobacterium wilhelmae TaxID=1803177 RepID=UPI00241558F4|nr:AAA family ATPase [Arcanobacterium wilhelmae]WFN89872.1 AAA family ATPase [Arcanobacterium wilhelmae]
MVINPFKPTLGATPPALVGREAVLDEFRFALRNGPGTHERVSVVTGPRGIGKTTLLNAVEDLAAEEGWVFFSETATTGFVNRLIAQAMKELAGFSSSRRVSGAGVQVMGTGVNVQFESQPGMAQLELRSVLTELLDHIDERDKKFGQHTGLLITLDELHHLQRKEVIDLATAVQHLVRENRNISLVMAGIPSSVVPLLANEDGNNPITFLRRANRVVLGNVSDSYVRVGLEKPVTDAGYRWEGPALDSAVNACAGYPFLIQLVGQYSFANASDGVVTASSAESGIETARRKIGQLVHEPALADLSDTDRTFLIAMSQDDGPSAIRDIAERLHVSPQYANTYRKRLIEAEMIESTERGFVDFTLPYIREYLREHYAQHVFFDTDGESDA